MSSLNLHWKLHQHRKKLLMSKLPITICKRRKNIQELIFRHFKRNWPLSENAMACCLQKHQDMYRCFITNVNLSSQFSVQTNTEITLSKVFLDISAFKFTLKYLAWENFIFRVLTSNSFTPKHVTCLRTVFQMKLSYWNICHSISKPSTNQTRTLSTHTWGSETARRSMLKSTNTVVFLPHLIHNLISNTAAEKPK